MRRPLGLWIFLSAGVLLLNIQDVHGLRGRKSTTSTTTSSTNDSSEESSEEEADTTEVNVETSTNSTKHVLTGNPQIDYIWDPNLPKELNGYNLSDYPFYERVPENITFKCDGLHDGFYASVLYKCQVYHHCLFGTRYDFLCANYTAFDQKTFICHFASKVDCNNSKKFWHRNDALYQAATTTTTKPLVIYKTPPPPPLHPPSTEPPGFGQRRVVGRPYRRRRPYYEYYDEYYDDFYYDDRPRSRGRKRPRPRPRPLYDDDYEDEYDDERYERRGSGGRRNENRRPYNRRPNRGRIKDRPRYDYDEEDEDSVKNHRKPSDSNKKSNSKRRPLENDSKEKKPEPTIIKPVSGTIYDRPRVAPKIKPPVPKSEANKYAYKQISTTEEYEDLYEEIKPKNISNNKKENNRNKTISKNIKKPIEDYYYDYDEEEKENMNKDIRKTITTTTTTTTTTLPPPPPSSSSLPFETTEPLPQLDQPAIIRLVKRPFLPSRGGNPLAARGLQPVGTRALTHIPETNITVPKYESDFRPIRVTDTNEERRVLQAPKNPLDINVEDYDVTLNDALNPTLPNLPVRSYPTGFDVQNDYYNYQKTRYPADQTAAPATSDFNFKNKPQRYENVQTTRGIIREQPNTNYRGGYYSVIEDNNNNNNNNYRPRQSQNTQVYFSRY